MDGLDNPKLQIALLEDDEKLKVCFLMSLSLLLLLIILLPFLFPSLSLSLTHTHIHIHTPVHMYTCTCTDTHTTIHCFWRSSHNRSHREFYDYVVNCIFIR